MEGVAVDQDDAVVEEIYYEKDSSSRSSWKLCCQTALLQSEYDFYANVCYNTAEVTAYC